MRRLRRQALSAELNQRLTSGKNEHHHGDTEKSGEEKDS